MTVQDLDKLVSKTELNPVSKIALRSVRKAMMTGRCGDAVIGRGSWSISMDTDGGSQVTMSFSFKRES